jgi:hypothetical protein
MSSWLMIRMRRLCQLSAAICIKRRMESSISHPTRHEFEPRISRTARMTLESCAGIPLSAKSAPSAVSILPDLAWGWSAAAPLRLLPRQPRSASFDLRIAIVRARSKFALLGRKSGKSRLFLPRSANSGFALRGRFLEKRLRVVAKTRQISSVLPPRFGPIWKSSCASWRKPGRYARFTCASWEKHGTFLRFQGQDVPVRGVPSQRPLWPVSAALWPVSRPSHLRRPKVSPSVARRRRVWRPSVGDTARSGDLRRTSGDLRRTAGGAFRPEVRPASPNSAWGRAYRSSTSCAVVWRQHSEPVNDFNLATDDYHRKYSVLSTQYYL